MSPTEPTNPNASAVPGRSGIAGLLSPLRATFESSDTGFLLAVEPMRSVDLADPWAHLADAAPDMTTILIPVDDAAGPLPTLNEQIAPVDLGRGAHAVTPTWFSAAVGRHALDHVAVLVEGPVEPADAAAIGRSLEAGYGALEGDLRAIASARVQNDRTTVIETREAEDAVRFFGATLRRYVAAVMKRAVEDVALPDEGLLLKVLERTGHVTIRPLETEMYATFIDIGMSTACDVEAGPADTSLIYDRVSNTWHG